MDATTPAFRTSARNGQEMAAEAGGGRRRARADRVSGHILLRHKTEKSKAPPVLTDAEARKLVTGVVEPVFPPGSVEKGTEVVVQISVDESGKLAGVGNTHKLKTAAFLAAYAALKQWHFQPYLKDGKPQYFHADIVFKP